MTEKRPRDSQRSKLYRAEREAWTEYRRLREADGILPNDGIPQFSPKPLRSVRIVGERRTESGSYERRIRNWRKLNVAAWVADVQEKSRWFRGRWPNADVWVDLEYRGRGWSHGGGSLGGAIQIDDSHLMSRWVVLHEMAHVLQPRGTAWHGREFCRIYLDLVSHFISPEAARCLRASFVKHKVRHRARPQRVDEGALLSA